MNIKISWFWLGVLGLFVAFWSCQDRSIIDPPPAFNRGDIISSTPLGQYSPDAIQQMLAGMNATFIANVRAGAEPGIIQAIQENTLLNWTPKTPIHFFHGTADGIAPYQNARTAIDCLKAAGATDIRLTTIPGGTHNTASLPSVPGTIGWFEQIRNIPVSIRF